MASTKPRTWLGSRVDIPMELPKLESWLCVVAWIAFTSRAFHAVWTASSDYKHRISCSLAEGWTVLGTTQDMADSEWSLWRDVMSDGFYKWIIGHAVLSQTTRKLTMCKELRCILLTMFALMSIIVMLGWHTLLVILVHMSLLCGAAWLTRSSIVVWIMSILLLVSLSCELVRDIMVHCGVLWSIEAMISDYGVSMSLLRSTSCSLTICSMLRSSTSQCACHDHQSDSRQSSRVDSKTSSDSTSEFDDSKEQMSNDGNLWQFTVMLCYICYLPLFYAGPLMTYSEFYRQFNISPVPLTGHRLMSIACLTARVLLWAFILELTIHYIYAAGLLHNVEIVQTMPLWAVAGVGYVYGQLFMVKYFVIWGGFGALAMLDQLDPPGPPACISQVYRYSRMWRSFDRGLYMFMTRHIYIPLGGSRSGFMRQLLASFLCFLFVGIWHGMSAHIIYWVLLNFTGITLEAITDYFYICNPVISQFESKYLSGAMKQRLHCLAIVPLCAMCHFAIFTFFGGSAVGFTIFHRLIVEGFPTSLLLVCLCEYCFIQSSKALRTYDK